MVTTKFDAPLALINPNHHYQAGEEWVLPKKSLGGYSLLFIWAEYPESLNIEDLRAQKLYPCLQTYNKWFSQFHSVGNVEPKYLIRNHHAICKVRDEKIVKLALFQTINPKATIAEIRAYLFNIWGGKEPLHSPSQIGMAENFLGIPRKVGSTNCFSAYLPTNLA